MLTDLIIPRKRTATCIHCGLSFEPLAFMAACCSDECVDAEKSRRGLDRHGNPVWRKTVQDPWLAICPPRYAHFDFDKLPARGQAVAPALLGWNPFHTPGKGIAIVGESDGGKSMLIHEAARQAFAAGWDVYCTLSTEFAWNVGHLDRRERYLQRCMDCAILLLDDLGKAKITERVETDLYHILEHRERWQKAIIWSANSKGSQLATAMSEDRAAPIINRLRRSAEVFTV